MEKRIFGLGIVLIILLFLVANSNFELHDYKAKTKADIQRYVDAIKYFYSPEDFEIIENIAFDGKEVIDKAGSKDRINKLFDQTIDAIDSIETLRYDELKYTIWKEIIDWSYLYLSLGQNEGATYDNMSQMWLDFYYGSYNGFLIFHFREWDFGSSYETIVDEFSFITRGTHTIYAVSKDKGMTLIELYEDGYITKTELVEIYNTYTKLLIYE